MVSRDIINLVKKEWGNIEYLYEKVNLAELKRMNRDASYLREHGYSVLTVNASSPFGLIAHKEIIKKLTNYNCRADKLIRLLNNEYEFLPDSADDIFKEYFEKERQPAATEIFRKNRKLTVGSILFSDKMIYTYRQDKKFEKYILDLRKSKKI